MTSTSSGSKFRNMTETAVVLMPRIRTMTIEWLDLPEGWLEEAQKATGLSNERIAPMVPVGEKTWRQWKKHNRIPMRSVPSVAMRALGLQPSDVPGYEAGAQGSSPGQLSDAVSSLREFLDRALPVLEEQRATVLQLRALLLERDEAHPGQTAQAIELLRRHRTGQPVPADDLRRVADAVAAAIRDFAALEAELREAAQLELPRE